MADIQRLKKDYPWIQTPLIIGAPMRLIALGDLAVEISKAGGIGFIGAGTDVSDLSTHLDVAISLLQSSNLQTANGTLPIGVGVINWGASLPDALSIIQKYRPAAVWFFSPSSTSSLVEWTQGTRRASPETKVWVQIGSVKDAFEVLRAVHPDVLVVQGTDAGGHGLAQGASLITLLPEVIDAVQTVTSQESIPSPTILAAGGITESRGAAASFTLGASGVVLGTRFLASPEANISKGYQNAVLGTIDGGQTTVRTKVYDDLRGTTGWAETYNGRGIINKSYTDSLAGMAENENKKLYEKAMEKGDAGWGVEGRMTAYAGAGVGLVREVKGAAEIVREVREGTKAVLEKFSSIAIAGKL
ncbi:inosine monophosphate dehydrogenase [Lentithecium fluviatile CBS 122367]|uniref:Inosine monophosphate dehydrogenase n=1 Tax=Lentithecium fluviatile CBS 122367 TaxID=1168545 RepID=A0A6G1J326_9PLEO|nr:inosine monophosphate dehydrogenase [Lentithecium fluviatile CBS 122367]